jgi:hypothetical protein
MLRQKGDKKRGLDRVRVRKRYVGREMNDKERENVGYIN